MTDIEDVFNWDDGNPRTALMFHNFHHRECGAGCATLRELVGAVDDWVGALGD